MTHEQYDEQEREIERRMKREPLNERSDARPLFLAVMAILFLILASVFASLSHGG